MKRLRIFTAGLLLTLFITASGCSSERYAVGPTPTRVVVVHHHPRVYHARTYHPKVVVFHKPHRVEHR